MAKIKGITIEIDGNAQGLDKALSEVNKKLNSTQKSLNAVDRQLKFDPSNVDLLTQRQELLKKQIDGTKEKVDALKQAQSKLDNDMANGVAVDEQAYNELKQQIIITESKLGVLENQSKSTESAIKKAAEGGQVEFKELKGEIDKTSKSAETASNGGFTVFKGALANLASAGIQKCISGLKNLASRFMELGLKADDLNTLSNQTGISTADIQKMEYAADVVDVSVEDITGSLRKMKKNMISTSSDTVAAWETLGVSVTDSNGKMRNATIVFYEVLNALSKVSNETQRDQLAMQLFGKSADNLAGIVDDGGKALKELGDQAENAGVIMSQDALDGANEFNDSMDVLKATATGAFNQISALIAGELAPQFQELAEQLNAFLQSEQGQAFIANVANGIVAIANGLAQVVSFIVNNQELVISIIAAITTAVIAFKIAQLAANAAMFASPITWIIAAIGGLIAIIVLLIANWDKVKVAVQICWNAIKSSVSTVIGWIKEAFVNFVNFNVKMLNGILSGAEWVINKIIAGVNWGIEKINYLLGGISDVLAYVGLDVDLRIGKVENVQLARVPYLWKGGIVDEGGQAIIGDKGPEQLTVQNGKAYVTPTNAMASSKGSSGVNVTIQQFNNYDTEVDTNALAETVAYKIDIQSKRVLRANG